MSSPTRASTMGSTMASEDDEDGIDTQEVAEAIASLRNDDPAPVRGDSQGNGGDA